MLFLVFVLLGWWPSKQISPIKRPPPQVRCLLWEKLQRYVILAKVWLLFTCMEKLHCEVLGEKTWWSIRKSVVCAEFSYKLSFYWRPLSKLFWYLKREYPWLWDMLVTMCWQRKEAQRQCFWRLFAWFNHHACSPHWKTPLQCTALFKCMFSSSC